MSSCDVLGCFDDFERRFAYNSVMTQCVRSGSPFRKPQESWNSLENVVEREICFGTLVTSNFPYQHFQYAITTVCGMK